jgi:hypothetical protein
MKKTGNDTRSRRSKQASGLCRAKQKVLDAAWESGGFPVCFCHTIFLLPKAH